MSVTPTIDQIAATRGAYIDDFQSLFRFHQIHTGTPEDFSRLASILASRETLRSDFFHLAASISHKEAGALSDSDLLSIVALALGGPDIRENGNAAIPAALLSLFSAGLRDWEAPEAPFESLLSEPDSAPAHAQQAQPAATQPNASGPPASRESPPPDSRPPDSPHSELRINGTLERLELDSLQLKRYLDAIEQRVRRMEPHLEDIAAVIHSPTARPLIAPLAQAATPPPTQAATPPAAQNPAQSPVHAPVVTPHRTLVPPTIQPPATASIQPPIDAPTQSAIQTPVPQPIPKPPQHFFQTSAKPPIRPPAPAQVQPPAKLPVTHQDQDSSSRPVIPAKKLPPASSATSATATPPNTSAQHSVGAPITSGAVRKQPSATAPVVIPSSAPDVSRLRKAVLILGMLLVVVLVSGATFAYRYYSLRAAQQKLSVSHLNPNLIPGPTREPNSVAADPQTSGHANLSAPFPDLSDHAALSAAAPVVHSRKPSASAAEPAPAADPGDEEGDTAPPSMTVTGLFPQATSPAARASQSAASSSSPDPGTAPEPNQHTVEPASLLARPTPTPVFLGQPSGSSSPAPARPAPAAAAATTPASASPGRIAVPSNIMMGNAIATRRPEYPTSARAYNIQGTVVVEALISKEGGIQSARAISGPIQLRASAVDALRSWQFKPYLVNGKPVEVNTHLNFTFQIP